MNETWKSNLKEKTRSELIRIIEELVSERDARQGEIYRLREEVAELQALLSRSVVPDLYS